MIRACALLLLLAACAPVDPRPQPTDIYLEAWICGWNPPDRCAWER